MTVAAFSAGRTEGFLTFSPGSSDQAISLENQLLDIFDHMQGGRSIQPVDLVLDRLYAIFKELSGEDRYSTTWPAVTTPALEEAEAFLYNLDFMGLPLPEIEIDVDGGIEFEWYKRPDFIFSMSFDGLGFLGFSALLGDNYATYGTIPLSVGLPDEIETIIAKFS